MTRHDDLDYTTLTWVKRELDETLKQARQAMESYVEDQADASQMRFCATFLHQVQGTLRMVELYGAAQVAEEMEVLASHLVDTARPRDDEAFGVLLRGMVQLPDYLERLQSGHKDVPIVLLPLINELRAARGQAVLSAASLFAPNLQAPLPDSAGGPKAPVSEDKLRVEANRLRNAFQTSLTRWMRDDQPRDMVARLFAVLERLRGITSVIEGRRLWWIAQAVVDGVKTGALDGASRELKLLFGKIDREIKRMVDFGEESFRVTPPTELCNHLLYHVATAKAHTPRMIAIRDTYKLVSLLPDQREIHHAQQSLAGRNRALLDTVGGAIREDLLRVKDALDIHLRTAGAKVGELLPLAEQLGRIADTLGMLGLGAPRKVVLDQKQLIEAIAKGDRAGDENSLLDIAGSLLYVEASLDDHIERLDISDADQAPTEQPIPQAELRRIMEQTMREAQQNLQSTKEAIVAFIESPWDHERLAEAPKLMEEVVGALRVIQHEEAGAMLDAVKLFVQRELLAHKRVPNAQQLDVLADAIVSVEYYLEALREQRPGRERALEVARRSVAALSQFGEAASPAAAAEKVEDLAPVVDATLSELERSLEAVAISAEPEPVAFESAVPPPSQEVVPVADTAPLDEAALAQELSELTLDVDSVQFGATLLQLDSAAAAEQELPALDVPTAVELPADLDDLDRLIQAYQGQPPEDPEPVSAEAPVVAPVADEPVEMTEAVSIASGDSLDALIIGETAPEAVEPNALETGGLDLSKVETELSQLEPDFTEIGARLDAPEPAALADLPAQMVEPAPVIKPAAVAAAKPKVASGFEVSVSNDIDEEIREVFLEEVQEVLDDLGVKYPQWKAEPTSAERLVPIRRSFHTLKGSGRLVGAMAIGEFSWKIENMLNRVLDKTIEPTPQLIDLMDNAMRALPGLLDALRGEGGPEVDVGAVMHVAERLAAGDLVTLAEVLPADEPVEEPAAAVALKAPPESGPEPHVVPAEPQAVETVAAAAAEPAAAEPAEVDVAARGKAADSAAPVDDSIDLAALADLAAAAVFAEQPVPVSDQAAVDELGLSIATDAAADALAASDLADALADLDQLAADLAPADEAFSAASIDDGAGEVLAGDAAGTSVAAATDESAAILIADDPTSALLAASGADAAGLDLDALDALAADLALEASVGTDVAAVGLEPPAELADDALAGASGATAESSADALDELAALDALAAIAEDYSQSLSELDVPEVTSEVEFASSVDPVLLEILRSEVAAHLAVVDSFVATASADHHHAATEALMRAVHTLNGAVSMIDIGALGDVTSPLESYIKRLYARQLAPSAEGLDALGAASAFVAESVNTLDRRAPSIEHSRALVERLARLRDALPPPEPMSGVAQIADQELADLSIDGNAEVATDAPLFAADSEQVAMLADEVEAEDKTEAALAAQPEVESEVAPEPFDEMASPAPFDELAALESAIAELKDELADAVADSANDELALSDEYAPALVGSSDDVDFDAAGLDLRFDAISEELATSDTADATSVAAELSGQDTEQPAAFAIAPDFDIDDGGVDLLPADIDGDFGSVEDAVPIEAVTEEADVELASVIDEQSWFDAGDSAAAELPGVTDAALTRFALDFDPDPDGPLTGDDLDLDLLDIFLEEGNEILDSSDNLMARLREDPINRDYIIGLQRDLHTLKGGARMAGLAPVGDLSHSMESLFETLADGKQQVTRLTIEALESAFDRLHAMINRVAKRQSISDPVRAVEQLEALTRGELSFAPPVPVSAVVDVAPIETTEAAAASDDYSAALQAAMDDLNVGAGEAVNLAAAEAPIAPAIEPVAPTPVEAAPVPPRRVARPTRADEEEDTAGGLRTAQEVVRVRADLLDNLVNFAGEVSIYRSRLEQQIGSFRFNLLELDQTVLRLREQLRKLEIETEAQILSRYQREMEDPDREFDPLELDRFSTLQQLSRALAESVSDLQAIQGLLDDITRQSETLLLQQSRVSSELQEGLMRTRMVPFESLVPRLRRILRQTSSELDKRAQLRVEGAQGEMDRNVLDRMTAPLEHMLRNALAHGVETPADRKRQGKPEEGTVTINVTREATEVVLRVSDDGAGVSRDAVRRKAIERGLLRPDVQVSDRDLLQFILETGFSTADQVSKVAGRGVGMDVVASEIKQLGGSLQIDSTEGQGTVFTVRLPFTLAVTHAIMVRLGEVTYALPLSAVQGVVRMPKDQFERELADPEARLSYAGEKYRLQELKQVLGLEIAAPIDEVQVPLVLIRTGDQRAAVRVDSILGSREIVVKSVGPQMSSVPGIFGATILGDGSVVIILDLAPLLRKTMAVRAEDFETDVPETVKVAAYEPTRQPLVLVVDDSITMRKVTTRVLERHAYEAITAKDGLDAVGVMAERVPDLVLLDIEMPRMDGYELAVHMRNDSRLRHVPIIMITSRTGEKHRQRAMEVGVNRYLGKPYQEPDLLANVKEALKEAGVVH